MTYINKCHLANSRITRWILGIQEYDFDIVHCPGKANIVADLLSRYPEDLTEESKFNQTDEIEINANQFKISKELKNSLKVIGPTQLSDNKLELINKNSNKKLDKYCWHNNKLYRHEKGNWRLVIPKIVSRNLIKEIH